MSLINKILVALIAAVCLSFPSQADIVNETCQFSVEYNKISFQHPKGCAEPLLINVEHDDDERAFYLPDLRVDKEYLAQHYDKAAPPACPDGFAQLGLLKWRIVSQIYRNYRKGADNVVYETIRTCRSAS